MMPIGIQLQRSAGWRLPPGAVVVSRPSKWGNPFKIMEGDTSVGKWAVVDERGGHFLGWTKTRREAQEMAASLYRGLLLGGNVREQRSRLGFTLAEACAALAGKDLACWCELGSPCHRDVLLEAVNDA